MLHGNSSPKKFENLTAEQRIHDHPFFNTPAPPSTLLDKPITACGDIVTWRLASHGNADLSHSVIPYRWPHMFSYECASLQINTPTNDIYCGDMYRNGGAWLYGGFPAPATSSASTGLPGLPSPLPEVRRLLQTFLFYDDESCGEGSSAS